MKKTRKYRWNKKTFFKNVGMFFAVVILAGAFDYALFLAFFGEAFGLI